MESLLGQLYGRIKGSQEDIVSEGLSYILKRSMNSRTGISNLIKNECGFDIPDLVYSTQNIGDNRERPDISGFDSDNKEIVIIESKFWSGLTESQPIEYLKRLQGKSVLMFICPTLRVRPLSSEIIRRLTTKSISYKEDENHSIMIDTGKFILVKTWDDILGLIKDKISQEKNHSLGSDIDQLIGFCELIDNTSFIPILDEELSPSIPKRINSFYVLVDKVFDELSKTRIIGTRGYKTTPQTWGYRRYGDTNKLGFYIDLNFEYWEKHHETPFWFGVKNMDDEGKWVSSKEFIQNCKKLETSFKFIIKDSQPYFPIFPLVNETEDVVIKDMTKKIQTIIESVQKVNNQH